MPDFSGILYVKQIFITSIDIVIHPITEAILF